MLLTGDTAVTAGVGRALGTHGFLGEVGQEKVVPTLAWRRQGMICCSFSFLDLRQHDFLLPGVLRGG